MKLMQTKKQPSVTRATVDKNKLKLQCKTKITHKTYEGGKNCLILAITLG